MKSGWIGCADWVCGLGVWIGCVDPIGGSDWCQCRYDAVAMRHDARNEGVEGVAHDGKQWDGVGGVGRGGEGEERGGVGLGGGGGGAVCVT